MTTTKNTKDITIQELAEICHVSTTTVFRFCKKLGLAGFSELKAMLKYSDYNQESIVRSDFKETYHQVVNYIALYDTNKILEAIKKADKIFLLARTDSELRLAKDFQRIFFPLEKPLVILPNNQALLSHKKGLDGQMLWIFQLDSQEEFPIEMQSPFWMKSIFTVLMSDFQEAQILADEILFIPNLSQKQSIPKGHITPFSLAVEILYLKLQLE
ncbi:MurR/RpiR family transcriptional regulator [Streptococcus penaeicida]|uniref:MurR/RpiR family transcriptional regulator n=1 Tax=Streptococcus penaeicida TaxID=1765960 RepID=UPI001FE5C754|nr:MurR/RpiR family transcriptional regulator [Streptococcus penaeicida]